MKYYDCGCGGTFYADQGKQSFGIAPCSYFYECDNCQTRKVMTCIEEQNELFKNEMSKFESQEFTRRSYKIT